MVARRITKQQRKFLGSNLTGCFFFIHFFNFSRVGVCSVEEKCWANDVGIEEEMERLIITVTSSDEDTDTASETDDYSDTELGPKGTDGIISAYCSTFGSFCEGFIFAKLRTCKIS